MYEYQYRPLIQLFICEFIFFCGLWLLFLYKRYSFYFFDRIYKKQVEIIVNYLTSLISKKTVFFPKAIKSKRALLMQLEIFDKNFSHDEWDKIKHQLLEKYLLPYAEKQAGSLFWEKRMFAVRCFALANNKEFEDYLIRLVQDKNIMIRIYAAKTLIHLESKVGIEIILEGISKFTGYCYYLFQDFFQNSTSKVIDIIIVCAKNPKLFGASVKVLASLVVSLPITFLKKGLVSKDIEIRLLAIKLFYHNPTKDAEDILIKLISDKNQKVQIEAIKGLGWISTNKGIVKLQEIFHYNRKPKVILEAARALHALGKLKEEKISEYTDYVFRFG
jgi:hypothetical protein